MGAFCTFRGMPRARDRRPARLDFAAAQRASIVTARVRDRAIIPDLAAEAHGGPTDDDV
jgi:hypothetical protein